MLALQREIHARVASGEDPDTWIVVEHDPVITLGRNAKTENVLLAPELLAARGIDVVAVERGGDVTYHGPGQLVVYPIVKLSRFREVVPFVSSLESAVIAALATFSIIARTHGRHRGVYVADDAICALGLAVKQMTSMHGLALNVATELAFTRFIIPCGTPDLGVTSMSNELRRTVSLAAARDAFLSAASQRLEMTFESECLNMTRTTFPSGSEAPTSSTL